MSETKQAFSIDKPGAYKLRGGGIADILGVNDKYAFGWLRSDTSPMSMRRWDRTGVADAGCWDIIAAIPFVVDGPGRYMMRNGGIVTVTEIARDPVAQPVTGMDRDYHRTWYINGDYHIEHQLHGMDLVRKMHPLEQEPGAKSSEAPKAPETQAPLDKPVFKITEPGVYCTRNGRVVNIHEVTSTTAHGHWKVSGNKREWPLNGRTHTAIDLGSDIVMKAPAADCDIKITDVLTRLRTDWDRWLAEQEEQARKNSRGPKTPKTPPPVHIVVQGIDGKPTQQPSEEQLKLAYKEPERAAQLDTKPTFRIDEMGTYATQDGHSVAIFFGNWNGKEFYGQMLVDGKLRSDRWDGNGVFLNDDACNVNGSKNIVRKCTSNDFIENRRVNPQVPEIMEQLNKAAKEPFRITEPGDYRTRDGRLIRIFDVSHIAIGCFVDDLQGPAARHYHWLLDGRRYEDCISSEDIVSKALDVPKLTDPKKSTVAITQTGKYRTRDGRIATITHVAEAGALGFLQDDGDIARWMLDGRHNEHCETEEDIVEKVEQENPEPKKPSAEAQAALSKALSQKTAEPKKPSAGFDVVIIKSNDGAWTQIVAGGYSEHNGVVTVNPADAHESYMTSKRPGALILKKGDFVRCPTHNVTCVIHYGGEE